MTISGHNTASVFERYDIVDVTDRRQALRQTQQYVKKVKENVIAMPAGR